MVAAEFVRVELNENQVGLRTENGALVEVLAPATRRLYWKGLVDVKVEVIDITASAEVPAPIVARLVQTQLRHRAVNGLAGVLQVQVPEHGAGILWVDGKVERLLAAGLVRVLEVQPQRVGGTRGPAAAGARSHGPGNPDPRQGCAAAEPVGYLALHRRAEGLQGSWPSPRTTCTASCSSACARRWAPARSTSCWRTRR